MMRIKKSLKRAVWCSPETYFRILSVIRSAGRLGLVPKKFAPPESYDTRGLVDRNTQIVIEGFPRSGNSFAVVAMEISNEEGLRMAHHFHVPAQVIFACRHGIPALVIIRDVRDAVVSQKIRTPSTRLDQSIRDWISFYRCLLPYRNCFVIAEFSEVVSDFGEVVGRINLKYGTEFKRFEHTSGNTDRIFSRIERWNASLHGKVRESIISRPSAERDGMKAELLNELEGSRYSKLLRKADSIYRCYISGGP